MFELFRKKKDDKTDVKAATGHAATMSAQQSTQEAAVKYAKPDSYTGNRSAYDSGAAKKNAKMDLFDQGVTVQDPYTKDILTLTKKEAKALYGEDWQKHLAESDHVYPLHKVYEDTKNNVWNTVDDIKEAANSSDNLKVVARNLNNAKRDRTNEEFVKDEKYLDEKGVEISEEGKEAAIRDSKNAQKSIKKQLRKKSVKNVIDTGHEAGMKSAEYTAQLTGVMSGITNMVAVIKGEKSAGEAVEDVIADSGKAAVSGYAMGGGLTVLSHSLSASGSSFVQALTEANVPGKVITAVMVTGDTLKQYANGEITTQECIIQLGEKGLSTVTVGYSMTVGQALIPIPVVGAAVGALVGSMATSEYYNHLIQMLQMKELEHQERLQIIDECNRVAEQAKAYRLELESYLNDYFADYKDCFDDAVSQMNFAFETGDADGMIAGANKITRKLGGKVYYNNVEEFKTFFDFDVTDEL